MLFKNLFKKENEKEYVNMEKEIWKKIPGASKYEASNFGKIRTKDKNGHWKEIAYKDKNMYKAEIWMDNGEKYKTTRARIIAQTFNLPNPNNRHNVSRIDGNTLNDRVDNLSYTIKVKYKERGIKEMEKEYSDKDRIDFEELNKQTKPLNEEIWKWVVGYERWYEVSNLGNVRKINDDGTKRLLVACDVPKEYTRGRIVNLAKTGEKQKVCQICKLVAEAFNIPNTKKSKTLYHIDGNVNNDCLTNLTYDEKETEAYIEEQRKIKEEQEKLELEKQEQESHKSELLDYIENNKEFLQQTKERNQEITITDVYNKLCEILEA